MVRFRRAALAFGFVLAASLPALAAEPTTIDYGKDPLQQLDYFRLDGPTTAAPPLVVFVHGGSWQRGDKSATARKKAAWSAHQGYAFAAINYRLVPQVDVASQAQDVADALAALRDRAGKLGFDPDRIVLMGHSAGAQLAALVATDERYAGQAGLPLKAIRAVVLLDTAGYDVPRAAKEAPRPGRQMYLKVFGSDEARQSELSPISHTAQPNARLFVLYCLTARQISCSQSESFAQSLETDGTSAKVIRTDGMTHREINRQFGMPGNVPAQQLSDILKAELSAPAGQ